MKQKELSVWLRIIVILFGLAVLFLTAVIVPEQADEIVRMEPDLEPLLLPGLLFVWFTTLPVLAALVLAWLIFTSIGEDNSFCTANAMRLRAISILALADTVLYILCAVVLALMNLLHPALLLLLIGVVFIGVIMTIVSAALSHLTKKAADMKAENDLVI